MATIRRSCCSPSRDITSSCRANNRRSFDLRSPGRPREEDPSQEPATQTRFGELSKVAPPGTGARRLAVPTLREHAEPAGTSPQIPQPLGWRLGAKPDHALRGMPRTGASRSWLLQGLDAVTDFFGMVK